MVPVKVAKVVVAEAGAPAVAPVAEVVLSIDTARPERCTFCPHIIPSSSSPHIDPLF